MHQLYEKRSFLKYSAALGSSLLVPNWLSAQTTPLVTEPQIEGPFFPLDVPRVLSDFKLDRDNDLIWVKGKKAFALGTFLELSGRVLGPDGRALPNIEVQLWQVDNYGRYKHPDDTHTTQIDNNFQGFGAAVSDGDGRYGFRTVKPVVYPGRTPHLHLKLKNTTSIDLLTTQMYLAGEPGASVTATLSAPRVITVGGVERQIVSTKFDIVLGVTPRIV
jgi:protocatechuate 3,4-dioxygenase, beta subunit